MTKGLFKNVAIALTAIFVGQWFVSCSKSDDGGTSPAFGGKQEPGIIVGDDGAKYRLTQADKVTYTYGSDGKLSAIGDYQVTYNPLKIGSVDNIKTNGNGYITAVTEAVNSVEINRSISYDSDGHLTNLDASYLSEGKTDSDYGFVYFLTWKDGKLMSVTVTDSDGRDYQMLEFSYGENALDNLSCQYTPNLFGDLPSRFDGETLMALSCIGYLGKGPSVLPTSSKMTSIYYGSERHTTYNYAYYKNSAGLVSIYTSAEVGNGPSRSSTHYMKYSNMSGSSLK